MVEAVAAELERSPEAIGTVLAATALTLAGELDSARNGGTSKSMCAKAMIDVMRELRQLAPPRVEEDEIDRARKRRAERHARLSDAAPASPS